MSGMNLDYLNLDDALRALAAEAPQTAPPAVEAALLREFRNRRRHARRVTGLAIAATLTAFAILLPHTQTGPAPQPAPPLAYNDPFLSLPDADTDPFDYGAVVRVELPNEDHPDELVQAEVLVSQDGSARAIRFLQ